MEFDKLPDFLEDDSKECNVWKYFNIIRQMPRPSKGEDRIRNYIIDLAKKNALEYVVDEIGNVLVSVPSNNGSDEILAMQSHMDMVCEKDSGKNFNFNEDKIELVREGDILKADGTTLGADNGIGLSMMLAFMDANNLKHPNLELIFTVDEEQGLNGAMGFKKNILNSKFMINLDSEADDEFTIGSAGGIKVIGRKTIKRIKADDKLKSYKLKIFGLQGGHSGCDIQKYKIGNALVILSEVLGSIIDDNFYIYDFIGGSSNNAIPRDACAEFLTFLSLDEMLLRITPLIENLQKVYEGLLFELQTTNVEEEVLDNVISKNLIKNILSIHSGVYSQSYEVLGLVQSSNNLGVVKTGVDFIYYESLVRSFNEKELDEIAGRIKILLELDGFEVEFGCKFPFWEPVAGCSLLNFAIEQYQKNYGKKPKVGAIHAGLECGVFIDKYPHMQAISIGPNIHNVHSPQEYVEISSVNKFWLFLVDMVENFK